MLCYFISLNHKDADTDIVAHSLMIFSFLLLLKNIN